ncbi:hemolysin-III related-domain-containing protein [Hyaloraphidium curvatum]|nr:hemolysin-III related-domain-containing protein [Hyaloraphidium curvatum]
MLFRRPSGDPAADAEAALAVPHSGARIVSATNPHGLLRFEDLPAWLRDNFYIITGYRPELSTYTACLRSIFYVHNESGNIWTHLFGAALFVGLAAYTYAGVFPALGAADWRDAGVFAAFFLGAFVCLSMSGFFHTFCAHSAEVSCRWNKIDYVGIVALIVGSFFPPVFYGFYCQPAWQYAYLAGMTILGSLCAIFAVADAFQHPSWRWFRTSLFLALGCCGVVPLIHILVSLGYPAAVSMGMWYMVAMGLMYVAGAMLYGFRWPERQWPGRFDYVGQSHQIFHVLVVAAAAAHWLGTVGSARWRHDPAEGRWACGA